MNTAYKAWELRLGLRLEVGNEAPGMQLVIRNQGELILELQQDSISKGAVSIRHHEIPAVIDMLRRYYVENDLTLTGLHGHQRLVTQPIDPQPNNLYPRPYHLPF